MKRFIAGFFALLIAASLIFMFFSHLSFSIDGGKPVYVGVAFQGCSVEEAKLQIDRVKGYTNLFVIGVTPVTRNETSLNEVAEYVISNGLNLMVNFGYYNDHPVYPEEVWRNWTWQLPWLESAKLKWGDRFLGVFYDDEPGGMQLDYDWTGFFEKYAAYFNMPGDYSLKGIFAKLHTSEATGLPPSNYDLEARYYVEDILRQNPGHNILKGVGVTTLTSDYGLYWFDYLGGYDIMLAQFGWNHSTVQDIALVKGAARLQNKLWGAIITWKYESPPYLDSGDAIYRQMVQAYDAGASYITIFNFPELDGTGYGVMRDEHFAALERFWNDTVEPNSGRAPEFVDPDVALVLPRNYGWGMRNPEDKIWGMWETDDKSGQIWEFSRRLLSEYGLRLDIVYDDPAYPLGGIYNTVFYWNDTKT